MLVQIAVAGQMFVGCVGFLNKKDIRVMVRHNSGPMGFLFSAEQHVVGGDFQAEFSEFKKVQSNRLHVIVELCTSYAYLNEAELPYSHRTRIY